MTTQIQQPAKSIVSSGFPHLKLSKSKLNFMVDVLLLVLLVGASVTAFVDIELHKWLGTGMAAMLVVHLIQHWSWVKGVVPRIFKVKRTVLSKAVVDLLLLVVFMLITFSGLVVMMIYAPSMSGLHSLLAYALGGLVLFHLFLNRDWIVSQIKRF
jgi:hypothetical protein